MDNGFQRFSNTIDRRSRIILDRRSIGGPHSNTWRRSIGGPHSNTWRLNHSLSMQKTTGLKFFKQGRPSLNSHSINIARGERVTASEMNNYKRVHGSNDYKLHSKHLFT